MTYIKIYCAGRSPAWRRYPTQAADGTWYAGWQLGREGKMFINRHWRWECHGFHKGHHNQDIPIMRGGSRYGYQMCMQNLREHWRKYHDSN